MNCPYGGCCIDPGDPSDCEINSRCVSFKSVEERQTFDNKPDKFLLIMEGTSIRFKTNNQLRFFLTDFPDWKQSEIYFLSGEERTKINDILEIVK